MNIKVSRKMWVLIAVTLAAVALTLFVSNALAQGTDTDAPLAPAGSSAANGFSYQGRLLEDGLPVNGLYDFEVTIWDSSIPMANLVSTCLTPSLQSILVEDGIFTLYLFPDRPMNQVFDGQERWIEIAASPAGANTYTILGRQPIAPTPYAWGLQSGAVISGTPTSWGGWVFKVNMSGAYPVASAILGTNATGLAVAGQSPGGTGVYGYTRDGYGVYGYDAGASQARGYGGYFYSTNGIGVYGYSNALPVHPNLYAPGVYGRSAYGSGVYGRNDYAAAGSSAGVTGESTDGIGVRGYSENDFGVKGSSSYSHGVYGSTSSTDASGVVGVQNGYLTSDWSLWSPAGFFGGRDGVVGLTKENSGYGVAGRDASPGGGWAGYFASLNGSGVYISAPAGHAGLNVASGTKSAVVRTDEGSKLLYSEESTEVWFSDYGFGQLEDGVAVIVIDETFAQTVNLEEPYHVFVQVYGDVEVYVSDRTPTQFEVHLREGDPGVEFSYRIVAKRLGYEDDRLEAAPWADGDPNLYPEQAALDGEGGGQQPQGGSK